jgi:hypothetical protein
MIRQALRFVLTFVILLGLFVSGARLLASGFKQCVAHHQTQDASSTTDENPSTFSVYVECTGDFIDKNNGSITALATIIIAAFTATLWRATTKQSDQMREAFIADKRAFVFAAGVHGYHETDVATGAFNWRLGPVWQNSGETATSQLRLYADGFLSNIPISDTFDFDAISPNNPPGPGMLGPRTSCPAGQVPHIPMPALTPQDILDIQNGKKYFYLWGWAKYRDTVPGAAEHISRFCWRILCTGNPLTFDPAVNPNTVSFLNIHEKQGNCADDECQLQGLG